MWVDRSRILDPTGQVTCQMKKRIHCTSVSCASIIRCTSGISAGGSPSALEPEVTESGEFYAVNDEIRRWSSLSEDECQRFVEDGVLNEFEMMW